MRRILSSLLVTISLIAVIITPLFVHALAPNPSPPPPPVGTIDPLFEGFAAAKIGAGITGQPRDPRGVVASIIRIFLSLLGTMFVAILFYAGFLWMTGGGEEEKIKKAKGFISAAIIGLLIVLTAYAVSRFVFDSLSNTGITNM